MLMGEKRSFRMARRCTTIRLEKPFWDALEKIARDIAVSLGELIEEIDRGSRTREERMTGKRNLASCLRVFCLMHNTEPNGSCEQFLKAMP